MHNRKWKVATRTGLLASALIMMISPVRADEPRKIPLTRPEMKQYLEDMKSRTPRIPLPELTAEEKAKLGERGATYENRVRTLYLPTGEGFGFGGRPPATNAPNATTTTPAAAPAPAPGLGRVADPKMTLDYAFKTELFWIVSRTNNCQYCLGHQESKLLAAGLAEDQIAALDGDWATFSPAQRAAFAFARTLTYEPYRLNDADVENLRKYYNDLQILEMVLSVAGNNAINRWKEGLGVPQSHDGGNFGRRGLGGAPVAAATPTSTPGTPEKPQTYLTPTSEQFQNQLTKVAPVITDAATGKVLQTTVSRRPKLESREAAEAALKVARTRAPRIRLVMEDANARTVVSDIVPESEGPLPQWVRLLANFPREGVRLIAGVRAVEEKGELSPLLKAQISWIIARQDRAWYALGYAKKQLQALGQTEDQIYALDGDWSEQSPKVRALFTVARKLAASPVVLTDEDVAAAVKLAGPRDVVQTVNFTTNRASFDRITEAAGLPLD